MHPTPFLVPASLASSSFGIPVSLEVFFPCCALPSLLSALNLLHSSTDSMMPALLTSFLNFSVSSHLEPKFFATRVIVSFDWESKVGFSTRQPMKIHMWSLICFGEIFIPVLSFLLMLSVRVFTTMSETWSTCFPPLRVAMLFTKLICWKPWLETQMATSHLEHRTDFILDFKIYFQQRTDDRKPFFSLHYLAPHWS